LSANWIANIGVQGSTVSETVLAGFAGGIERGFSKLNTIPSGVVNRGPKAMSSNLGGSTVDVDLVIFTVNPEVKSTEVFLVSFGYQGGVFLPGRVAGALQDSGGITLAADDV
jgi:hypothetical protein